MQKVCHITVLSVIVVITISFSIERESCYDMALICRVTLILHNTSFTGEEDEEEEEDEGGGGTIQYSSLRREMR